MDNVWDILRLASIIRWAPYESEDNAIESAFNITDRAIEKAVSENNKTDLETITDELEMSMELDERADEVKKLLIKLTRETKSIVNIFRIIRFFNNLRINLGYIFIKNFKFRIHFLLKIFAIILQFT